MVGSSAGGRLSTTNQPRSSSDLAAVDRPAPDMPVMMTMSGTPGVTRRSSVMRLLRALIRLLVPPCSAATTVSASLGPMPGHRRRDLLAAIAADTAFTEPNAFSSAARRDGPRPGTPSSAEPIAALPRLARW